MHAKTVKGEYYTCEGCGLRAMQQVKPGALKMIKGWRDGDDDWVDDLYEGDVYEAAESIGLDADDLTEAMYTECPNGCDSDDGWEMDNFDKVYICGLCLTTYYEIDAAANCCDKG